LWLKLGVLLDVLEVTLVERNCEPIIVIESMLVFLDGGTNEVLMLDFKKTMEFLRFRGGIVFDVEEIRKFGGSELGLEKGNELMSLAWVAVERVCVEIEFVQHLI
jgi:hypothetical protein